ncbi:MAG: hypothetical protein ACQEXK_24770 [Bacillota bacterium]
MNKKIVLGILSIVFVASICICIYIFMPEKIEGKSKNEIWKVEYTEVNNNTIGHGGIVSVEQLTEDKLDVKKISFYKNHERLSEITNFMDKKDDIDGTVYTLNPFSYPDIYMGDAPDKHASYFVEIIWTNASGKNFTESINLK